MKVELFAPVAVQGASVAAEHALIDAFGGVTKVQGEGSWRDAFGQVVVEPVEVLSSYTFVTPRHKVERIVRGIAAKYLVDARQEAVLFTVAGEEQMLYRSDLATIVDERKAA